ncbi:putative UDP-sugar transporter protein SLC35A4 [Synchiropus picturatus]
MIAVQNYKSSVRNKRQLWQKVQWGVLLTLMVLIYGSHAPLISVTKVKGHVPFNASSCVILIESAKLLISLITLVLTDGSAALRAPPSLLLVAPYAVPAVLYALNNNLVVHMQAYMDPSSFQVLSNLKIASTALLYSLCLSKTLRKGQWVALGLLMCAGVCQSYTSLDTEGGEADRSSLYITVWGLFLVFVYCSVSGLAAVYTEKILKSQKLPLSLQNLYLYVFGVVINGMLLLPTLATESRFLEGFSSAVWAIVIGQTANGLLMSVVLKHGSGITRLFVISCSMLVNALLSWAFLGLQLSLFFLLPVSLVGLAAYLYYR